jgi:hypothetical protein
MWEMSRSRSVGVGLLALALAGGGLALALRAFQRGGEQRSASPRFEAGSSFPSALDVRPGGRLEVGSEGGGSLLFAFGSLWVSASANDGTGAGHIVRIDPSTNNVEARIPVDAVPTWEVGGAGIAAGAGSVWVTGGGRVGGAGFGAILHRIDPGRNEVEETIQLDGKVGYDVAVDTDVWVIYSGPAGRTVAKRIDPSTNEVLAMIELEHEWAHWIVPTEAGLLVLEHRTSGGGGRAGVYTVIDPKTNGVAASSEPRLRGSGNGLAVWGGQVWTNAGGYELTRIDPFTGEALNSVEAPLAASTSEGLAVGEGGIWFVGYQPYKGRPETLNRLNPASGEIDVSAEVGTRGTSIAVGDGAVWLLDYGGSLFRFDLAPPPDDPGPNQLEPYVAPVVAGFMKARVEGTGAERFLSGEYEWNEDGSDLRPLYASEEERYENFGIVFVDSLGDGTFEVGVRMLGADLDGSDEWRTEPLFEETIFVGPGTDREGRRKYLLVNGARSGLDGP